MPNAEDTRRATGQDGCSQPIADGGLIGVNHGRIIVFVRGQEEGLRDNPSGIGGAVPPTTFFNVGNIVRAKKCRRRGLDDRPALVFR